MLVVQPFLANLSIAHRSNRFHLVPRYSTAQAAAMLASENSWDVLREHEELFSDPDYCGIHPEAFGFTQAARDHVWENARIFRKAGGTSVPLGIFKTQDGRYIPLFGDNTASEIRSKIELS